MTAKTIFYLLENRNSERLNYVYFDWLDN